MFDLLSRGALARNRAIWPRTLRSAPVVKIGAWPRRVRYGNPGGRCVHMPTTPNNSSGPSTDRLWTLADISAFLRCSDATAVTRLPGFPAKLDLPGVAGYRWVGACVIEYFTKLTAADGVPATYGDTHLVEVPVIPAYKPAGRKVAS